MPSDTSAPPPDAKAGDDDGALPTTADASADGESGPSCVAGKCLVAQPECFPRALAHSATTNTLYWTELCGSNGGAIRKCSLPTGCPAPPTPPLYAAGTGFTPVGIAAGVAPDGNEYVWNTDAHSKSLWRILGDGSGRTQWGAGSSELHAPRNLVSNGTHLAWAASTFVYRGSVAAAGAVAVLEARGGSHIPVTVDQTRIYAVRQGVLGRPDGVVACSLDGSCILPGQSAETQIYTGTGIGAIAADGSSVFVAVGTGTYNNPVTTLYRCPLTGCAAAQPSFAKIVGGNVDQTVILAVDQENLYVNALDGGIYACPRAQPTCAAPKLLQAGVHATAMLAVGGHLYWAEDGGAPAIFRTKP